MEWFIEHLSTMTPAGAYMWLAGILVALRSGGADSRGHLADRGGIFRVQGRPEPSQGLCGLFHGRAGRRHLRIPAGTMVRATGAGQERGPAVLHPARQRRVRAYFQQVRQQGRSSWGASRRDCASRSSFSAGMLHLRPSVFFIYDTLAAAISVPGLGLRGLVLRRSDRSRDPAGAAHRTRHHGGGVHRHRCGGVSGLPQTAAAAAGEAAAAALKPGSHLT